MYKLECVVVYRYALWSTIVQSIKFVFPALHMIFIPCFIPLTG